ncbi:MAG TPA: hypothetical protein VHK01_08750 [Lacipirellulaceae bacterium]|jgi:hypothetical protein|nr:hypothetical protein [Lacipirellulaceae bacterium]
MASQRLIIVKLGGRAAEFALDRFRYWRSQRTTQDRHEWDSLQWAAEIRSDADAWFESLRQNALLPPVLFYAEYVDLWSYCPPARFIGELDDEMLCIVADRYEGFCTKLPLKPNVLRSLKKTRSQWPEDQMFSWLTLHGAQEWNGLVEGGSLVFLRQIIRGSVEDHEVVESLRIVPDWMIDTGNA